MNSKCALRIEKLVAEVDEWNALRNRTGKITPKQGRVVRKSKWASARFYGVVSMQGKWYPGVPRSIFPPRSIFCPHPIEIAGVPYYLELKGYGLEGRELFFSEHDSGDVYYGMYLETAEKEFKRLQLAVRAGLPVPFPIAVVEIPREEYIKHGLKGFEQMIDARIFWVKENIPEWLAGIVGTDTLEQDRAVGSTYKLSARRLVSWIIRHPKGLEWGIEIAMNNLAVPGKRRNSLFNTLARSADALLTGKRVGYLIRATKCPMRVGGLPASLINTEDNQKIAFVMGKAFKGLLELGFLHHCPGTGNWTLAGEITDLQDTFDLANEQQALHKHMARLRYRTLRGFVKYLIGPKHTGKLCLPFMEGICGREVSLATATEEVYELILQKMKTR